MGKNSFKHVVDASIYSKEAILETCYRLNKRYSVILEKYDSANAEILISNYDSDECLTSIIDEFAKELVDQQIRHQINKETLDIRKMIVAEAFSPLEGTNNSEDTD